MNKIKYAFLALFAAVCFSACNENDYDYTPGQPSGKYNVGFASEEDVLMSIDDKTIKVELTRENGEGELEVPLKAISLPECMSIPSSVKFANGETTTSFDITCDDKMEAFVSYPILISVPEEYTQAYREDALSASFSITALKEDFAPVANAYYTDLVLFGDTWEQTIEYSEYLDLYRMPDVIYPGTPFYFHFDGKDFYFTDSKGNKTWKFDTGYVHPSYGMISANINDNPKNIGYTEDPEELEEGVVGEFYFVVKYTVSAGSFGENYNIVDVVEWIKKPWVK